MVGAGPGEEVGVGVEGEAADPDGGGEVAGAEGGDEAAGVEDVFGEGAGDGEEVGVGGEDLGGEVFEWGDGEGAGDVPAVAVEPVADGGEADGVDETGEVGGEEFFVEAGLAGELPAGDFHEGEEVIGDAVAGGAVEGAVDEELAGDVDGGHEESEVGPFGGVGVDGFLEEGLGAGEVGGAEEGEEAESVGVDRAGHLSEFRFGNSKRKTQNGWIGCGRYAGRMPALLGGEVGAEEAFHLGALLEEGHHFLIVGVGEGLFGDDIEVVGGGAEVFDHLLILFGGDAGFTGGGGGGTIGGDAAELAEVAEELCDGGVESGFLLVGEGEAVEEHTEALGTAGVGHVEGHVHDVGAVGGGLSGMAADVGGDGLAGEEGVEGGDEFAGVHPGVTGLEVALGVDDEGHVGVVAVDFGGEVVPLVDGDAGGGEVEAVGGLFGEGDAFVKPGGLGEGVAFIGVEVEGVGRVGGVGFFGVEHEEGDLVAIFFGEVFDGLGAGAEHGFGGGAELENDGLAAEVEEVEGLVVEGDGGEFRGLDAQGGGRGGFGGGGDGGGAEEEEGEQQAVGIHRRSPVGG